MPNIDAIIQLDRRTRKNKFGKVIIEPDQRPSGPHGVLTVPPQNDEERGDLSVFLARLIREFQFNYRRDSMELSYEHGNITLAKVTFYP